MHSRLLLDLQDEITCLEKELDDVDWDDEGDDRLRSREIDVQKAEGDGDSRNRRQILAEIKTKLMEYGTQLASAHPFAILMVG